MSEVTQTEFKGWAKVEVMGHQSHVGFMETQAFGGTVLFRIDRPAVPEEEETLTSWDWCGSQRCGPGTIVKRPALDAATVMVGAGSIYRIIPCDEATAMKAIRSNGNRPLLIVKLAELPALEAGAIPEEDDEDDEDEIDNDRYPI